MNKATNPKWALEFIEIIAQRPAAKRVHAIFGNVKRSSARRPNVSIVQIAGKAKRKLMSPKPKESNRAWKSLKPDFVKIVEE